MPRYRRLFLPQYPLHIVQRGHDQQPVFAERADYEYYLTNLVEMKNELSISIYAYCLMTNHVHLLILPDKKAKNVSQFIRIVAARQTRYVNKLENRTGTLWDGRFKASLVDSDSYLLTCYRYIDLNPVRAGLVMSAVDYEWSSYRQHIARTNDIWLDHSDAFMALGVNNLARSTNYQSLVSEGSMSSELSMIRTALTRNQVTGNEKFRAKLAKQIGRRVFSRGPGRPKKNK